MPKKAHRSAIDPARKLPWGTHFCQFYESHQDLLDIVVPYLKSGLRHNEYCIWITCKPLNVTTAANSLRKTLPGAARYLKKGQLEILPHTRWYLKGSRFNGRRVLNGWIGKSRQALARGYDGMRLTGDTLWLTRSIWRDFAEYEDQLDRTLARHRMTAMCAYPLQKARAFEVIDVINNHGYALIRHGTWQLIENFQRRKTEELARAGLEKMVEQRTEELARVNQRLHSEIAQREQVEQQLRKSREQLRALAGYLQSVREEERTRIARELHDEVGQALTAVKLSLERSVAKPSAGAEINLSPALELTNELIGRVRDLSLELRPAMLDDLGLLAALRWHFDRYTSQFKIDVDFEQTGLEGRRFSPQIETAVYRMVQEALTNVARHAGVDRVTVGMAADVKTLYMKIADTGDGFDPGSLSAVTASGLSGMRERAILLGGHLEIDSAPGKGTRLTIELPLADNLQQQKRRPQAAREPRN